MTKTDRIEGLNILLIFISLFFSIVLPFEIFLFSYAILGPLHYLTEINWLHQKNYFIKDKKNVLILIFFTFVITFETLFKDIKISTIFSYYINNYSRLVINILIISSFFFSIGLVLFKDKKTIYFSMFFSFVLGLIFLYFFPFSFGIIALFLPTLIHVYLFTILFMTFGTLKTRSVFGIISIIFLCSVPFFIFYSSFSYSYQISESIKSAFLETKFKNIIQNINQILVGIPISDFSFNSERIIKIQTFITFAYTYHYLNWFSKTKLIGWNKNISKTYLVLILVLWLASIALYFYNFRLGILTLFFLSMLHVIIEFPLNIVSIREVFLIIKTSKFISKQ